MPAATATAQNEARQELTLKLRSIAASANDAQGAVHDLEQLGACLEDMQGDLNRAFALAEKI